MKLITETVEDINLLVEETNGKKNYFIEGIFLQAELKNRNGRVYPIDILEREVNKYTESYIVSNRALGELGHPDGPTINLDRVSHKITNLRREGNNFIGKAKLLETPMGIIAKQLLDEGVRLGVSSRGMGSLEQRNGANYVRNDFMLATAADIVADPSAPDAFVNGIMEGKEWIWESGILREVKVDKYKRYISESTNRKDLEERTLKVFEDFLYKL
jgi:hypothetical protein